MTPRVSVVVPVAGDRTGLQTCLAALAQQDHPDVEVLVVDNGGNEYSSVLGRGRRGPAAPVRVVREPAPGSYAARNAGVAASSGSVLAFTDADCRPRPDWLSRGVVRLRAVPAPAFVGGRVQLQAADPQRPTAAELVELVDGFPQAAYLRDQQFAATANLLVTREVFDRVGPFRAELRSGGDREWGVRAHAAGVRGHYAAEAVVEHPCRATLGQARGKVRRVVHGDVDVRRLQQRAPVERGDVRAWLRPPLRRMWRGAREVQGYGRGAGLRYALAALYLHELELLLRLQAAARRGR